MIKFPVAQRGGDRCGSVRRLSAAAGDQAATSLFLLSASLSFSLSASNQITLNSPVAEHGRQRGCSQLCRRRGRAMGSCARRALTGEVCLETARARERVCESLRETARERASTRRRSETEWRLSFSHKRAGPGALLNKTAQRRAGAGC